MVTYHIDYQHMKQGTRDQPMKASSSASKSPIGPVLSFSRTWVTSFRSTTRCSSLVTRVFPVACGHEFFVTLDAMTVTSNARSISCCEKPTTTGGRSKNIEPVFTAAWA